MLACAPSNWVLKYWLSTLLLPWCEPSGPAPIKCGVELRGNCAVVQGKSQHQCKSPRNLVEQELYNLYWNKLTSWNKEQLLFLKSIQKENAQKNLTTLAFSLISMTWHIDTMKLHVRCPGDRKLFVDIYACPKAWWRKHTATVEHKETSANIYDLGNMTATVRWWWI